MGVPKGREAGETGGNYATLHNISQSKKGKREEAKKKGGERGLQGTGDGRFEPPVPPPPTKGEGNGVIICKHDYEEGVC